MNACLCVCPPAVDDSLPGITWEQLCWRQWKLRTAEVSNHVTRAHHLVHRLLLIGFQCVSSSSFTGSPAEQLMIDVLSRIRASQMEMLVCKVNRSFLLLPPSSSNLLQSYDICPFVLLSDAKVEDLLPSPFMLPPWVPLHFFCDVTLFSRHVGRAELNRARMQKLQDPRWNHSLDPPAVPPFRSFSTMHTCSGWHPSRPWP